MARDQDVEEVPQSRQGLVLGRRGVGKPVQKPSGQTRRYVVQLEAIVLAPGEKPPHLAGVGGPGVGIGEPDGEELVRGEAGLLSGPGEDGREGSVEVIFRE